MRKSIITHPVEYLYLALMLRWQKNAPADRHEGLLDGKPERNTQISRMAYVLQKVAAGNEDRTYQILATNSGRRDGKSYISKDSSWMIEPYPLSNGWYLEGCMNLGHKQMLLQYLTKLGLSSVFVSCADDFVAYKSIDKYLPTKDEAEEILREIEVEEQS